MERKNGVMTVLEKVPIIDDNEIRLRAVHFDT
jgi:hypothetical protein